MVITTPETCIATDGKSYRRELTRIRWDFRIVDEAHKIKNYDSKMATCLRSDFQYLNCLLLTGTPLQNNTDELWSSNFVDRVKFASREQFTKDYGDMKDATQLGKLHKALKPFLLRREKGHVEKKVPPKEEIIVDVELTAPQKQYYRALYEQRTDFLHSRGAKDGPSLTNLAMELRKCCNHPFLIKGAEAELARHFEGNLPNHPSAARQDDASGQATAQAASGRAPRAYLLSVPHNAEHHEDFMVMKGYSFERVDGSIRAQRQCAIDRYTNSGTDGERGEQYSVCCCPPVLAAWVSTSLWRFSHHLRLRLEPAE